MESRLFRLKSFKLELVETHRESELSAAEFFDLLKLDAVSHLDRSGVEQLQKFSDDSDAEVWNQNGDELLQTVVEVVESFADGGAAVGQPDLVSLDAAIRTLEDQIGVVDRSGFGHGPEFGQNVLTPFVLQTLPKHFLVLIFFFSKILEGVDLETFVESRLL